MVELLIISPVIFPSVSDGENMRRTFPNCNVSSIGNRAMRGEQPK